MIKISKFSENSGSHLSDSVARFKIPEKLPENKPKLWFLSGDMTQYGHKDIKMNEQGYNAVKKAIENPLNNISQDINGQLESRKALAKHLSSQLSEEDVIMVHGANIGLLHCILAIVNEGDNILIPEPSYPFYQKVAKSMGIYARPYKLLPEKKWEVDLNYLESLIDERTKFIWVVNPSNPCGSVFSRQHLQELLEVARKHKKLLIGDEVYYNESFENVEFTSIGQVAGDQPVIVIGGMEKTFCVPGWCVSWITFFDEHKRLTNIKNAIRQSCQFINSPPEVISGGLPEILDKLTLNFTKNLMPIFYESYTYLYEKIKNIKGLSPIEAQGTFYLSVLIDLEKFKQFENDQAFLQRLLEEENIFILSLNCFGGGVQGFRLMMAAPMAYYDGFIERLTSFCEKYYEK